MSRLHVLLSTLALDLYLGIVAQNSVRDVLLAEGHLRVNVWHKNHTILEEPLTKDGISLTMLKHDMKCGGAFVPVGFAEFVVPGVRPVDVFNTVMNVAAQPNWNKRCDTMKFVGNFPEEGARGWDNVFNLIFNKKLEFLVWQVADADFEREDFWMVTSTQENARLREKSPKQPNWIESHNCLGAYHVTKDPQGARVVVTQHVSSPFSLWFPFHEILKVFPFAWKGMLDFISSVQKASENQRKLGWNANKTDQPKWLLESPKKMMNARSSATPVMVFAEEPSTMPQTTSQRQWLRIFATFAFIAFLLCCCCAAIGIFHFANKRRMSSRTNSECGSTCSGRSVADLSDIDDEYSEFETQVRFQE